MSLTSEDKEWMQQTMALLIQERDDRLTALIGQSENKLTALIGQSADKLTALIGRSESNMTALIGQTESKMSALMSQKEDKLIDTIRDVETNLLTAFHKWASPTEARLRTHAATLRAIDLEMEALSDRVVKLEPTKPGQRDDLHS